MKKIYNLVLIYLKLIIVLYHKLKKFKHKLLILKNFGVLKKIMKILLINIQKYNLIILLYKILKMIYNK